MNAKDRKTGKDAPATGRRAPAGAEGFALGHRAALITTLSLFVFAFLIAFLLIVLFRPEPAGEPSSEGPPAAEGAAVPASPFAAADFPMPLHAGLKLLPPHEAVAATRLASRGGPAIEFAYVEGLGRDAVCHGADGRRFPCGLMARAWLQNFLGKSEVECEPRFTGQEGPRYQCFAAGEDLALRQVRAGFARPAGYGLDLYEAALAEATGAGAGAWNGGWRVDP